MNIISPVLTGSDGDARQESQAAELTLNVAILRAKIAKSYEDFFEIFETYYADEIEVSSEAAKRTDYWKGQSPLAVFESQKKPAESHSALIHQRGGALADFLQRHFEAAKLLRGQLRKHSLHLPGMLSEGENN